MSRSRSPVALVAIFVLSTLAACNSEGPTTVALRVTHVQFSQTVVAPGQVIDIGAEGVGEGTLTYSWSADAGELGDPSVASTTWTAPSAEQVVALTITISDGSGDSLRSSTLTTDIVVGDGIDHDGDGFSARAGDCDDTNPVIYPGAPDIVDGFDNDCDGELDEGAPNSDDDEDGWTDLEGDCNDADATVNPDASESANGVDDDCDGFIDEGTEAYDDDGDGFTELAGDCNDNNSAVAPGAPETQDDLDNDCDGEIDEGTAAFDDDGDGYSELEGDCDDANTAAFPGNPEIADGIDNDCNGLDDDGDFLTDDDGDGWSELAGDCDDSDFYSYPSAPEFADGEDNDCNGAVDDSMDSTDDDGDGFSEADGDCDDFIAAVYPGAIELEDGLDNDCDGYFFFNPPEAVGLVSGNENVCSAMTLDASGSWDPDDDALAYYWYFAFQPINSTLSSDDIVDGTSAVASFTPDVPGPWAVALLVNDGMFNSVPDVALLDVVQGSCP